MPRLFDIIIGLIAGFGLILVWISNLLSFWNEYKYKKKQKELLAGRVNTKIPKVYFKHIVDEERKENEDSRGNEM